MLTPEINTDEILPAVVNVSETVAEVADGASTSLSPSNTPEVDKGPSLEEMKQFIHSSFGNSVDKLHSF